MEIDWEQLWIEAKKGSVLEKRPEDLELKIYDRGAEDYRDAIKKKSYEYRQILGYGQQVLNVLIDNIAAINKTWQEVDDTEIREEFMSNDSFNYTLLPEDLLASSVWSLRIHGRAALGGEISCATTIATSLKNTVILIHGPIGCAFQWRMNPCRS